MSILDDAIREHLELKRQHGADDAELKRLEDEAFGPPARPEEEADPFAEAPTEFLVTPGSEGEEPSEEATRLDLEAEEGSSRRINVADLQEPPPPPEPADAEAPADEEQPAMEHEVVQPADEAPGEAGPSDEDRQAIAEQPTEIFDVEGELAAASEGGSPSDEDLADAELSEPRLAPVDPIGEVEASGPAEEAPPTDEEIEEHADEFDEFFSEQRLSDELNQALEAPLDDEPLAPAEPSYEEPVDEAEPAAAEETEPHRNFAEEEEEEEEDDLPAGHFEGEEADDEHEEHPASRHEADHQDALEDTPDFLADDPEDDNLWFEQKPPKDIDFGD
ncbi:MAG TPA: hypothetical protein VHA54_07015 [Solirubrobacterales bacterium]|nr:hypothetical protein [Solirubrobacterales bacterium]